MFAVIAAILFGIGLIIEAASIKTGISLGVFLYGGLLGVALHHAVPVPLHR